MKLINIVLHPLKKIVQQARLIGDLFFPRKMEFHSHHDGVVFFSSTSLRDAYENLRKTVPSRYRHLLHRYHDVAEALHASGNYHIVLPTGTPMGLMAVESN
jgi:hypothetical protein